MARTANEIVRDTIGNQSITICELVAQVEALAEKVKELEGKLKDAGIDVD